MSETLTLAHARAARFERRTEAPSTASPTVPLELLGQSPAITRVHELLRRAAPLDLGVLLTAERGTDVHSVARELHDRSRRAAAPYVVVQCDGADGAAVAQALFGTPSASALPAGGPDAAVGATDLEPIARNSLMGAARGGTLFLHDVSELPAAVQGRLARIVRDGEVALDGEAVQTDIRFVASASPAVDGEVHAHRLRLDLFRRIAGVRIDLPPLRDRQEDVPAIATRVLEEVLTAQGRNSRAFTQAALALVAAVTWPGNLSELRAAVTRLAAEAGDHDIQVENVLPAVNLQRVSARFTPMGSLREARLKFEREYIFAVLQHHNWRIADAAQTLGIQRPNLYRKARQLGIPMTRISG